MLKKVEFTFELSDLSMKVYSDSSFTFYEESGQYYVADNFCSVPSFLGGLDKVESFLLFFVEE